MIEKERIERIAKQVKDKFYHESTGHDWFHINRVRKTALLISEEEGGRTDLIELAALLHDIADHKFVKNYKEEAPIRIKEILEKENIEDSLIIDVIHIVQNSSFSGGMEGNKMELLEGLIIQDADRLDAIGAIGIARTFAFGGKFGNSIYDPNVSPTEFKSSEEYRKSRTHTINHFYEKLLLLKDGMNTKTGQKLALQRHQFMEEFLEQFYREWNAVK